MEKNEEILHQLKIIKDLIKDCQKNFKLQYFKNYYYNKDRLNNRYFEKKQKVNLEKSRVYKQFLEQDESKNWKEYYSIHRNI